MEGVAKAVGQAVLVALLAAATFLVYRLLVSVPPVPADQG